MIVQDPDHNHKPSLKFSENVLLPWLTCGDTNSLKSLTLTCNFDHGALYIQL